MKQQDTENGDGAHAVDFRSVCNHGFPSHQRGAPKAKGPAQVPAQFRERSQLRSVLRNNGSTPVELVVYANQRLLDGQTGRDDIRSADSGGVSDEGDVLALEVHVVVFAEHRPAGSEHPFEAAADGPAEAIDVVGAFGQEGGRDGADEVMVLISPGRAALDVAENLRSEQ